MWQFTVCIFMRNKQLLRVIALEFDKYLIYTRYHKLLIILCGRVGPNCYEYLTHRRNLKHVSVV